MSEDDALAASGASLSPVGESNSPLVSQITQSAWRNKTTLTQGQAGRTSGGSCAASQSNYGDRGSAMLSPLMTHPQRHYCAISPLNAESLAENREPTDGRRNLADRLLSLAIVEFQDPAVISVGTTPNVTRASLHPTP